MAVCKFCNQEMGRHTKSCSGFPYEYVLENTKDGVVGQVFLRNTDYFDGGDHCHDCGNLDDIDDLTDVMRVELLHSYGTYSPIWNANGNNLRALMREARLQADIMGRVLFGFARKNKIGATGWDCLRGDILAPLRRVTPDARRMV